MSIPISQLTIWANQGATVSSQRTHESIRTALSHEKSPLEEMIKSGKIKVYLQGSYKNDTNIRADSDVDIVVELTTVFSNNINERPQEERDLHNQTYENASYTWDELRRDTLIALELYYGRSYVDGSGNKSIKVFPNSGRLHADVVPVLNYRKYEYFKGIGNFKYEEGVKFQHFGTKANIVNYPEQHYRNGANKHQATKGSFKHIVRIFKNARNYLVDKGHLEKGTAPSYFLQCLIYNVPDFHFTTDYSQTMFNVLNYLYATPHSGFVSQNSIIPLFGSNSDQWNIEDSGRTIGALVNLWNNWNKI